MFADIPIHNLELIAQAAWLLGSVGVGFRLPASADDQFGTGKPWDDVGDSPGDGHYVPIVGRNSHGNYLGVTWGRIQAITPAFMSRYLMICAAPLSLDRLRGPTPVPGFDLATAEVYTKTL
jgi:hypothetical protein